MIDTSTRELFKATSSKSKSLVSSDQHLPLTIIKIFCFSSCLARAKESKSIVNRFQKTKSPISLLIQGSVLPASDLDTLWNKFI